MKNNLIQDQRVAAITSKLKKNDVITSIQKLQFEKGISLLDAILVYCEHNLLDEKYVGDIIKKSDKLKAQLELEATKLYLVNRPHSFIDVK